jgi:chemotaxis protein methyltransferase CheR
MIDSQCVAFLQWALPRLRMRWPGFRKVRKQVCTQLDRRIKELGMADVATYQAYLEAHPDEWTVLDGFCRIPISRFYRDRSVFDCLRDEVLPELATQVSERGDQELRCWSAGCASGEEVYTLAIIWKLGAGLNDPRVRIRIVATDSDSAMLERARRACYSRSSLTDLPKEWLEVTFELHNGLFSVRPAFRDCVEFMLQDIRHEMPTGKFDLILCRHLAFTYFDESLQRQTLQRLLSKLLPGGIFVGGKQEALSAGCLELLEEYRPRTGIYRPAGSAHSIMRRA